MGEIEIDNKLASVEHLARSAAEALAEIKGIEILLLDLRHLSTFTDYFVIATAESHVQMKALADNVRRKMAEEGSKIHNSEGQDSKTWVLLDYSTVIVHIFSPAARDYYSLENLWGDAKETPYISQ